MSYICNALRNKFFLSALQKLISIRYSDVKFPNAIFTALIAYYPITEFFISNVGVILLMQKRNYQISFLTNVYLTLYLQQKIIYIAIE